MIFKIPSVLFGFLFFKNGKLLLCQAFPFSITLKEYGFNNWQKMPSMPSPRGAKERGTPEQVWCRSHSMLA
jgi:hypothetical protein